MPNKIAVSLAAADTETCLASLHQLAPAISMAEIRLDLMPSFNLHRIVAESPCPLIITCRPLREGGRFSGAEEARLDILTQATHLNCAYVDSEWDSLAILAGQRRTATRLIASRHWFDEMPPDLWATYVELRERADVVKLVGQAHRPGDMLPIVDLLRRATTPVIALAMGEAGRLTRLTAPCFPHCFLTYAAPTASDGTAAGQLSVQEMIHTYHVEALGPETTIHLHLCAAEPAAEAIVVQNQSATPGKIVHIPLVIAPEEAQELLPGLRACLPRLIVTADPTFSSLEDDIKRIT